MADQEPLFNQKDISDANGPVDTFVDGAGKTRLGVDAQVNVTVNELLGKDPLPDTYLDVTAAGAIGDTVRVQVAGINKDTTTPDRDYPAVDVTSTLTATEAGDEIALAELIVSDLNADTNFQNAELIAAAITKGRRAIVHITVTEESFSLEGEFSERPTAGDVSVSVTGTTTVTLAFDTIISRGKVVSLARDPENPHRLGILGIAGSVSALPGNIGNLFEEKAKNGSSSDLLVDGTTPVTFTVSASADNDIFIESLHFYSVAAGTMKYLQFLAKNVPLTNGVLVKITSSGGAQKTLFPLKVTEDFENLFATDPSTSSLTQLPSANNLSAVRRPSGVILLQKGSSDKIEVVIQDDLSAGVASTFEFFARGFVK